ncbi:hypothetical protein ACGFNU_01890 [Spirillospora sp. NPDC048911]|uniref:hypothetical protein n=1 Tax=Spirillospora sp. NPDC048911 TaxID=3364527 RepID=UPI003714D8A0
MARYATVQQLQAFSGNTPPADAERLLDRAAEFVDDLLLTARYATDAAGLPADPKIAEVLSRATCAQAAYWLETGDAEGAGAHYQSVHIGSITLTRGAGGSNGRVAPQAATILRTARLLRGAIYT